MHRNSNSPPVSELVVIGVTIFIAFVILGTLYSPDVIAELNAPYSDFITIKQILFSSGVLAQWW